MGEKQKQNSPSQSLKDASLFHPASYKSIQKFKQSMQMHTHTHSCMYTYACMHTFKPVCMHTHTHTQSFNKPLIYHYQGNYWQVMFYFLRLFQSYSVHTHFHQPKLQNTSIHPTLTVHVTSATLKTHVYIFLVWIIYRAHISLWAV